jgi:hypothetical protein
VIESESLVFGYRFGVVTDIEAAREGGLYVVSLRPAPGTARAERWRRS